MGQCSEAEELLLAFVIGDRSNILTASLHCKGHSGLNLKKKDSTFLSSLPVTWLYIISSDHRQEKSRQSNHSLHSPKLGKLPCCLLTIALLKPEIVPLTDITYKYKWHLLMHNYPERYVVERVSQLRVFKFYSLFSFTSFQKLINEHKK